MLPPQPGPVALPKMLRLGAGLLGYRVSRHRHRVHSLLEEGGVRLSIPLDLKNCSAAGFVVLFVRCATMVVPVIQEVIVIVVERPTLPSSSVVAVPSLARGLPAPSARVVVPVSVTHYFATLQWDME